MQSSSFRQGTTIEINFFEVVGDETDEEGRTTGDAPGMGFSTSNDGLLGDIDFFFPFKLMTL